MRHVLSAVVQNVPGVLAHVSGMLASRGYNIDSLAVGETEDPNLSRMTFVVVGDDRILDQVRKQLEKIVTVVHVDDISSRDFVEREIRVAAPPETVFAFFTDADKMVQWKGSEAQLDPRPGGIYRVDVMPGKSNFREIQGVVTGTCKSKDGRTLNDALVDFSVNGHEKGIISVKPNGTFAASLTSARLTIAASGWSSGTR